jgi:glycosyltransferase involved in cell wall biosynthesis
MHPTIAILIPAFQPDPKFPVLVRETVAAGWNRVVVINDGSDAAHAHLFTDLPDTVELLTHPVNLGKGAALKTGFAHIAGTDCAALITVDADGQHELPDIEALARSLEAQPDKVVLGVRQFELPQVPFRNRLGNRMIRGVFWLMAGRYLQDTQTGLRGVPVSYVPGLLKLKGKRYEYELEMLLFCISANRKAPWLEVPIHTVYGEAAGHSHFKPVADSWKIFCTLLRWRLRLIH